MFWFYPNSSLPLFSQLSEQFSISPDFLFYPEKVFPISPFKKKFYLKSFPFPMISCLMLRTVFTISLFFWFLLKNNSHFLWFSVLPWKHVLLISLFFFLPWEQDWEEGLSVKESSSSFIWLVMARSNGVWFVAVLHSNNAGPVEDEQ